MYAVIMESVTQFHIAQGSRDKNTACDMNKQK